MLHVIAKHATGDIFSMLFVSTGCLMLFGTITSLVASLIRWENEGKIIMCKINYVCYFHSFVIAVNSIPYQKKYFSGLPQICIFCNTVGVGSICIPILHERSTFYRSILFSMAPRLVYSSSAGSGK